MSTRESTLRCDKCGRAIESGKGYTNINGWIICGVCEWEANHVQLPVPYVPPIQYYPVYPIYPSTPWVYPLTPYEPLYKVTCGTSNSQCALTN